MTSVQRIDTGNATGRRTRHFTTLDEVQADVDRVVVADRAGKLRLVGNWTLGQIFGHLASWIDWSFDGVPMKVPWLVRMMLRPMKRRMLYKPMLAGSNIPRVPGGTLGADPISTEEATARLTKAIARLKAGSPSLPHLLFGKLTHDEWINMHLRHAELHLSFCVPEN